MALKRGVQRSLALIDYYEELSRTRISGDEQLKDVKSKMEFTQKQILKLCLEIKKVTKEKEAAMKR